MPLLQVMLEEVVAVVLYTGPMYLKVRTIILFVRLHVVHTTYNFRKVSPWQYNNVLRFFSGNAFLQKQCVYYKLGEVKDGKFEWTLAPTKYATTIHAINSAIIKLSQLTKAATVFRGLAGLRLPQNFFVKNKDGIAGGVDVGHGGRIGAGLATRLVPLPAGDGMPAVRLG